MPQSQQPKTKPEEMEANFQPPFKRPPKDKISMSGPPDIRTPGSHSTEPAPYKGSTDSQVERELRDRSLGGGRTPTQTSKGKY